MSARLVILTIIVIVLAILAIIRTIKSFKKSEHEQRLREYAEKKHLTYKPYFAKPMNDASDWPCFMKFKEPSFANTLEFENDYKGSLYIGELEFTAQIINMDNVSATVASTGSGRYAGGRKVYGMGMDNPAEKFKKELTMCVIYDKGMNLPYFDIMPETIKLKAFELFGMADSTDIDFQNDKAFSDTWWLSGQRDSEVRNLFIPPIRSGLMRFADKGYRICARGRLIFIIADKLVEPDKLNSVVADMKAIQMILQRNNLYYTPVPEPEDIENMPPANPTEFQV